MKVTTEEITLFKFGAYLRIPAGTQTTHNTAVDIDPNYNFIANTSNVFFKWDVDDKEYIPLTKKVAGILYHDIEHYGINIPGYLVKEI